MKRIILHWTAGGHRPNEIDTRHYHFLIDGNGLVHQGLHPVAANSRERGPLKAGTYAAHTANCNTDSIGIAICAMADAQERPFRPGSAPITGDQLVALATLVARLSRDYGIPITRETVLTHAEVQPTLGITQAGKWDITWLPGMVAPGAPVTVGDRIRALIADQDMPAPQAPLVPQEPGLPSWLILAFLGLCLAAAFFFGFGD